MTLPEMMRIIAETLAIEQRAIALMQHNSPSLAKRYVQLENTILLLLDEAKTHEIINKIDEQLPETD